MLKQYVLDNIPPETYYAKRFPQWNPKYKNNIRCPFHDDNSPSLSLALKNGGARCHAATCGVRFGNIVHFESELKRIPERITVRRLYAEFIRPVIDPRIVSRFNDALKTNPLYILRIKKEMGLSGTWIRRFSLGLDTESHRITIPVFDQFNQCVNIRYYRLPSERGKNDAAKIYNHGKGYGQNDLFPIPEMDGFRLDTPILWMGGEKETMLAIADGYQAVCSTGGEGSWSDSWRSVLENRDILLSFDNDEAGKTAAEQITKKIATLAKSVNSIILPFGQKRPDWKDYADWRLKEKHEAKELKKIIERSIKTGRRLDRMDVDDTVHSNSTMDDQLSHSIDKPFPEVPKLISKDILDIAAISSRSDLLNHRIKTQGIVAAKSPNTFSIPWKFEIRIKGRPKFEYELPLGRELLNFVESSDQKILQTLQRLLGSNAIEIKPLAYLTATYVEIIPTAAADRDVPYVVQRCIYFGERIEANVPYLLQVIPTSAIRSQETIGIITSIIPLSKSIDKFEMTPEVMANLSVFWPEGGDTVWNRLLSIGNELSHHYTRVYNRLDWHLVALLTWCSPIGFKFPGENDLQRGWINSLAIGDTETGKSKVSKAFKEIFKTGVYVNAENCTFVGLVGGAIKMGSGQLMLRWGRIPLSDKQLVILEEFAGLSIEEISGMSDVRSSGIARLDKGGINSETNARTRLLCLSNIRSKRPGANLSGYLVGVRAVQELVGHAEDIARFDMIITLVDKEVSVDVINDPNIASVAKDVPKTIQADQLQELIHFIWSLTPDQIHFTKSAYLQCLEETKKLSAIYHPSIPIFKGGSGRYKVARIAAAIACLQFSWDDTEHRVRVTREHVKAAARFLERLYNRPSLGYLEYSQKAYDREKVKDTTLLTKTFKEIISKPLLPQVIESMIHSARFTRDEICATAQIGMFQADKLIGTMLRERVIEKGEANLWNITPAGKNFMEKLANKQHNQ